VPQDQLSNVTTPFELKGNFVTQWFDQDPKDPQMEKTARSKIRWNRTAWGYKGKPQKSSAYRPGPNRAEVKSLKARKINIKEIQNPKTAQSGLLV